MEKEHYGESKGHFNEKKDYNCKFCGKVCHSLNSLKNHERRCKQNPDRLETYNTGDHFKSWRDKNGVWNKGLTKETDDRVRKGGETSHENYINGLNNIGHKGENNPAKRPEVKAKISKAMKKLHKEGKGHVWKGRNDKSYPEKWLIEVLKNNFNQIENKDYQTEKPYHKLFLDFVWEDRKLVIEIDGQQHYNNGYTEADKRKDTLLEDEGYYFIRIPWIECKKDSKRWIDIIEQFLFHDSKQIYLENKQYLTKYRQQFNKRS